MLVQPLRRPPASGSSSAAARLDYAGICAELSSPQLEAAADRGGIVWAKFPGYRPWPVSWATGEGLKFHWKCW